ncbi:hypothetical protein BAZ12_15610 [Elizabethkingia miricola]|uniref:hypothetical protein n=1 Tax=Elizabethkingia miricola TaxID=172045 RepID=UPI0009997C71|nr:hypothetical protein [Elizabethkingia miricola]OPC06825.1 hypothetical protein BAY01_18555 [Elizabethkingia miricola]OPC67973.1 hypothetical protein BAZ12_15610 [Elizabethkingia miricola]
MKKIIFNVFVVCLLFSCNLLLAQGIGLSSGMNEVTADVKNFAAGALLIGFLITGIIAVKDYSENKDIGRVLWIIIFAIVVISAIVGGYAFVKTKVKFN